MCGTKSFLLLDFGCVAQHLTVLQALNIFVSGIEENKDLLLFQIVRFRFHASVKQNQIQ